MVGGALIKKQEFTKNVREMDVTLCGHLHLNSFDQTYGRTIHCTNFEHVGLSAQPEAADQAAHPTAKRDTKSCPSDCGSLTNFATALKKVR